MRSTQRCGGRSRARGALGVAAAWMLAGCGPTPGALAPGEQSARTAATQDSAEPDTSASPSGPQRVFVGLKVPFTPEGTLDATTRDAQREAIARAQAALLRRHEADVAHVNARYRAIPFVAVTVDDAGLRALRRDPLVTSVTPDHLYAPTLAQSVPLVDAPWAWTQGASGAGVAVAVLDTGVDKNHPFLSGKVIEEACFSTTDLFQSLVSVCPGGAASSTASDSGLPCSLSTSGCEHGTHVAGIVAGHDSASSGVAPNTSIIAIQVFSKMIGPYCYPSNACARSTEADEVLALEHVLQLSQDGTEIAAVNMSLGGVGYNHTCDAESPATKAAIDNLRSVNVATVIASGNDGSGSHITTPGCISTAVSVGATTKADQIDTFYSNSASFLTLLAPGTDIRSSIPGGGFAVFSGTSMATPHVAGAFAVLKSGNPDLTVSQGIAALRDTGVVRVDPRNGVDTSRIDVGAALQVTGVFRVSAPGFSPPAGSYVGPQTVSIVSDTPDTTIRFTTDGTTPSANVGTVLAAGDTVTVDVNETIAAIALGADGKVSDVRYARYTLHGEAPRLSPGDGEYTVGPTVTVTAPTAGTALRVTTDGSTPTSSHGTVLQSGDTVSVSSALTLRAVATHTGWSDSPVTAARYALVGDLTVDLLPAAAAAAGARWRRMDSAADGFESGDMSRFTYTPEGDAAWSITADDRRYGTYALRSPALQADQHASFSATVTTDGGSISFSRKVSSEEGYDMLTFLVDGVESGSWSGEVDWSTVTVAVRPGEHTFTWTYAKDFTGASGADAAWVDQISFPGDEWRPSGDSVPITSTSQRIAFNALAGWTSPSQQTVSTALGRETRATGTYVALQAQAPWLDPTPGTYKTAQTLTLGSTTPGATVHYTLDGSAPTASSPAYNTPISLGLSSTTTVRAVAMVDGWLDSPESTGTWIVTGTAAAPTFDPPAGTYLEPVTLTITSATPGATIHYTLDGTPPGPSTPTYTAPLELGQDHTVEVRARAYVDTWADSSPTVGTFVLGSPLTITQEGGTVETPLTAATMALLTVDGGIGPFTVGPATNAAGESASSVSTGERSFTFTAPAQGAYAGTYAVTAVDQTTGAEGHADVLVGPTITLGGQTLTPSSDHTTVVVRGAAAGEAVSLAVVDVSGAATTGLADIQAVVPATRAPEDGNPASSMLVLRELDHDADVRVAATAGGVTALSPVIHLTASADAGGGEGPGCACDQGASPRLPLALAALVAWLGRRRDARGGASRLAA